jgi:cytidine deaminase
LKLRVEFSPTAWANGETSLSSIALSAPPCGHCRQFLCETAHGSSLRVLTPDKPATQLSGLLPDGFEPDRLSGSAALLRPRRHALRLTRPSADPVVAVALDAAECSYAPYSAGFAGVAVSTSQAIYVGRYAETIAFNPSVEPLTAAIAVMAIANVEPAAIERVVLVQTESRVNHEANARRLLALVADSSLEVHEAVAQADRASYESRPERPDEFWTGAETWGDE